MSGSVACRRVQDRRPQSALRAAQLAALPAQFEAIFRKHMLVQGVGLRDSAYCSVVDEEWPTVRASLERRVQNHIA